MIPSTPGGRSDRRAHSSPRYAEQLLGYLLVAPLAAMILVFVGYPFGRSVVMSFTNESIGMDPATLHFVGFENYAYILRWPEFWLMVRNTLVMTLAAVGLRVGLGMLAALTLNASLRGRGLYRAVLFLPWALPAVVAVLLWQALLNLEHGVLNSLLVDNLHLLSDHVPFLMSQQLAMPSLIAVLVWRGLPFCAILFLAALQTIPAELEEAAQVDGANAFQRWRWISLPQIRRVVVLATLLSLIWTSQDFDTPYLLTGGRPANATLVMSLVVYQFGVHLFQVAQAATLPILAFPIFVPLLIVLTRSFLDRDEEG